MDTVRFVSKILFWVTRPLAFIYFAMALVSMVTLSTGWGLVIKKGGKYFSVNYPFSDNAFLNGDNNTTYIVFYFLLPMLLYGIFFLLLGNIFRVFFLPKLFTNYGVRHLQLFYLASFIVPPVVLLLTGIFDNIEAETAALVALHLFLGVFAYFLAAIFRQGLKLQNEQDLYI